VPGQSPAGQWYIHKQVVVQNILVEQIQVEAVFEGYSQVEGHIFVVGSLKIVGHTEMNIAQVDQAEG